MNIYLAASLNDEQKEKTLEILNYLRSENHTVFLPYETHAFNTDETTQNKEVEEIFERNIEKIKSSDLIIAIYNGVISDTDIAWVIGYSFIKAKPVAVLNMSDEEATPTITNGCTYIQKYNFIKSEIKQMIEKVMSIDIKWKQLEYNWHPLGPDAKFYLAGPFSNKIEKEHLLIILNHIKASENPYIYTPHERRLSDEEKQTKLALSRKYFNEDADAIEDCFCFFAINWGQFSDVDTAWRIGYAYGLEKRITIFNIYDNDTSVMVANGCREIFNMDFNALTIKPVV